MSSPSNIKRILKEIKDWKENESKITSGIFIHWDESDITKAYILITGLFEDINNKPSISGSPYQGAFFIFNAIYPQRYPIEPLKLSFITPKDNNIRFHPNFYEGGKVCLSIINTWGGKDWTPIVTLSKVAIELQARMQKGAIRYEPSFEKLKDNDDMLKQYDERVRFHVLQKAVIQILNRVDIPKELLTYAKEFLTKNIDKYILYIKALNEKYGSEKKIITFSCMHGSATIDYSKLQHEYMIYNHNLIDEITDNK